MCSVVTGRCGRSEYCTEAERHSWLPSYHFTLPYKKYVSTVRKPFRLPLEPTERDKPLHREVHPLRYYLG